MNTNKVKFGAGEYIFIRNVKYEIKQLVNNYWQCINTGTGEYTKFSVNELIELQMEGAVNAATLTSSLRGKEDKAVYESVPPFDQLKPEQQEKIRSRRLFLEHLMKDYGENPAGKYIQVAIDERWLPEKGYKEEKPNIRKVRRWLGRYKESDCNILSLYDMHHLKGNRAQKIDDFVTNICKDILQKHYLKEERPNFKHALGLACSAVRAENVNRNLMDRLPEPTLTTFRSVLNMFAVEEAYAARYGKNAARVKFRNSVGSAIVDRPFQRWEIDHTKLDLIVVCEHTGITLKRPWLTVVIDRFTRAVMGYFLSLASPSSSTLGAILKHCIRPKFELKTQYPTIKNDWNMHGLPEMIVCDNGMEFHSQSFREACLSLGIQVMFMPRKRPEMKGAIERFIGTMNRAIGGMAPGGRTFHSIEAKGDYDPKATALLTMSDVHYFINKWIVDVYHQTMHRSLETTPQWMWDTYVSPADITYLEDVHVLDAIIGEFASRKIQHYGIELNHVLYNSEELAYLNHQGLKEAKIRWNTEDLGSISLMLNDGGHLKVSVVPKFSYVKGRSLVDFLRARCIVINKGLGTDNKEAMEDAIAEIVAFGINAGIRTKETRKEFNRQMKKEKAAITANAVKSVEVSPISKVDTSLVIHQSKVKIRDFEITHKGTFK